MLRRNEKVKKKNYYFAYVIEKAAFNLLCFVTDIYYGIMIAISKINKEEVRLDGKFVEFAYTRKFGLMF